MATINLRVDDNVKKQANEVFESLGLDMSTAINIFLRKAISYGGIPFELRQPNAETLEAMKTTDELLKNPDTKRFSSVDELREHLGM